MPQLVSDLPRAHAASSSTVEAGCRTRGKWPTDSGSGANTSRKSAWVLLRSRSNPEGEVNTTFRGFNQRAIPPTSTRAITWASGSKVGTVGWAVGGPFLRLPTW